MKNIFNSVKLRRPRTNWHTLSHDVRLSGNMGELIPVMCIETAPGETFVLETQVLARFAPLLAPIMHQVDIYTHTFFVPYRILWKNWEDFNSQKTQSAVPPAFPVMENIRFSEGSIGDYFGLPINKVIDKVSAMPFSAYNMIYREYYRDENLVAEPPVDLVDGNNPLMVNWFKNTAVNNTDLPKKRAWQHDYYTSALPWSQKGPQVEIPIDITQDVDVYYTNTTNSGLVRNLAGNLVGGNLNSTASGVFQADGIASVYDPRGTLKARTSAINTETASINNLRVALRLQEWFERAATAGTRYFEHILAHFGYRINDETLQRPQYICGSKQPMQVSEVLQTSETVSTPQGNMAGHGISAGIGKKTKYTVQDYGVIMTILSVMPKPAYQDGIPKMFSKFDRFDYLFPEFAHLSEQEIKNRELFYSTATPAYNDQTFGYQGRYSEYKFIPSPVS